MPTATPEPSATSTSTPTSTPTPKPTATPIPPIELDIHWPEQVSALEPVPINVSLIPPPGVSVSPTVRVTIADPTGRRWWRGDLTPQEGNRYGADEPLQLPLVPPEGDWLFVTHIQSALKVVGERHFTFQPAPLAFRDLTQTLPTGVDIRLPEAFTEITAQGDQWAGGRIWRHGDGIIELWWAPGPTEPLLLNNAIVMLETTYETEGSPTVLASTETEWQGQTAFHFREAWPESEGPSEVWVIQGPDYWLYVLRLRTTKDGPIPSLLRQVGETLTFVEEQE